MSWFLLKYHKHKLSTLFIGSFCNQGSNDCMVQVCSVWLLPPAPRRSSLSLGRENSNKALLDLVPSDLSPSLLRVDWHTSYSIEVLEFARSAAVGQEIVKVSTRPSGRETICLWGRDWKKSGTPAAGEQRFARDKEGLPTSAHYGVIVSRVIPEKLGAAVTEFRGGTWPGVNKVCCGF